MPRCETNILQMNIKNDPNHEKETPLHNHCSHKFILNKLLDFFHNMWDLSSQHGSGDLSFSGKKEKASEKF